MVASVRDRVWTDPVWGMRREKVSAVTTAWPRAAPAKYRGWMPLVLELVREAVGS